jgi:hypothetical protein
MFGFSPLDAMAGAPVERSAAKETKSEKESFMLKHRIQQG